jgi:hypothetical protein
MTARDVLGSGVRRVHARLDEVLDSEDAVIVLMDRRGATTFYHGFAASGCQLELFGHLLDNALMSVAAGRPGAPRRAAEGAA